MRRHDKEWRGYSLDEIRYRRLFNVARCEIVKRRMLADVQTVASEGVGFSKMGMMRKMLGALSYMDYGIIAYRLSRKAFVVISRLNNKKKE